MAAADVATAAAAADAAAATGASGAIGRQEGTCDDCLWAATARRRIQQRPRVAICAVAATNAISCSSDCRKPTPSTSTVVAAACAFAATAANAFTAGGWSGSTAGTQERQQPFLLLLQILLSLMLVQLPKIRWLGKGKALLGVLLLLVSLRRLVSPVEMEE